MSLGWKDIIATLLTALVVLLAVAKFKGWNVPLLDNWRIASLAALVLGFGICIVAGWNVVPEQNGWTVTAEVLGGLAGLLGLGGVIFGGSTLFYLLVGDIVVLWAISTLHHFINSA